MDLSTSTKRDLLCAGATRKKMNTKSCNHFAALYHGIDRLALAGSMKACIHQMDVSSAILLSDFSEELHMQQPKLPED